MVETLPDYFKSICFVPLPGVDSKIVYYVFFTPRHVIPPFCNIVPRFCHVVFCCCFL